MESPELETLGRVTKSLESASVPYMLTGSMALNFYGHPRATNDIRNVLTILADRLDFAYLERWAQALGLWKRLKGLYVPS